ncbi:hypothetical protein [Heliorestis convoluta]|uniref:HNH endonuclease n=1 Tax=Heliorestis convoluta TaxID=356322 RepID=A0A5Q2MZF9_9FIRM|nr:hypothetical protein [Heliorestis convoluta]QGG46849.1 hypothetical protein FTV88_0671 [Heliorestis convoluta]
MAKEKSKRLTPTIEVLRELYLKSGNQCAYPGCTKVMINSGGVFVGQVCHIEAAMPGGPRFNEKHTNEERRSFDNLMLMCYEHHKITDKVDEFPVNRLKDMKESHEKKFSDIASKLQSSITDLTTLSDITLSSCCKKINKTLGWRNSNSELKECSEEVNFWAEKLKKLPKSTRQIFCIMIKRSTENMYGLKVVLHEIEQVTGINVIEMTKHYEMLERYGFLSYIDNDDYGNPICYINNVDSGWALWKDLKDFTSQTTVSLEELVVNLNFKLLD